MSRRKASVTRLVRSRRAREKANQQRGGRRPLPREHLEALIAQNRTLLQQQRTAEWYRNIQQNVSQEFHEGRVQYVALVPTAAGRAHDLKGAMVEELRAFEHPDEEMPPIAQLRAASAHIRLIHQRWIDTGLLRPEPLKPWKVPSARVHEGGRVEAVDRLGDQDIQAFEAASEMARRELDR